jgi:hypothetical protein
MRDHCLGFKSIVELKEYVHERLCELEQLDMSCFPLSQQALKRGGELCGYMFSILGPRSIVFNAIFETDSNAIHFYNSSGERVVSEKVLQAPSIH